MEGIDANMSNDTYIRITRFYTPELSAKKAGLINRAMKDYRLARDLAYDYFGRNGTDGFGYSEMNDFYKEIHRRPDIELGANTVMAAIRVAEQNYGEFEKDRNGTPPTAGAADTYGLVPGSSRLFHSDGRYYLNVHTGAKRVSAPLRVTDNEYHQSALPLPESLPAIDSKWQRTPGVEFKELTEDDFPETTTKIGESTLKRVGERTFCADLTIYRAKRIVRGDSIDDCRYVLGVDRGRNQLAYAALYDREEDHIVDWWNRGGDEVRHYLDQFADRIHEFQAADAWGEMEDARERRFRYKKQTDYEIANALVDMIRDRFSAGIVLEDLSGMARLGSYSDERRRFNQWSYYRLEQFIRDKAEPLDIPVTTVEPAYTSVACSRCGDEDSTTRKGIHFRCDGCGYEQHADANAAANIAKGAC